MAGEAPNALIYGSDNFVAKKLGELLVARGISVAWDDDEVGRPLYFFDFGGGEERYDEMAEKKVKICRVEINPSGPKAFGPPSLDRAGQNFDWRKVNLHNVYGVGMANNWWLAEAVELAARNKNLVLPKYGDKFRVLAVDDAVEVIMRAVIMAGTSGKTFEVAGDEIESKEVAAVLIDLAKMTKTEIHESNEQRATSNEEEQNYIANARALRWRPIVEFREGIKEVVAEFVAKVDEEARKGKNKPIINKQFSINKDIEQEKKERMGMKVEVEDPPTPDGYGEAKEEEIVIEEEEKEPEITVGKTIKWEDVVPVNYKEKPSQKLEDSYLGGQGSNAETNQTYDEKKEVVIRKINFPWKKVGIGVGGLLVILILFLGYMVWGVVGVAVNLEKPIKLIEDKKVETAKNLIKNYEKQNEGVMWFWANTNLGEIQKISEEVLKMEGRLCDLADSVEKINGAVFEEKTVDIKTELTGVSKNLLEIEIEIGVVDARLEGVRKWVPGRWRPEVDKILALISKNIEMVRKMRQAVEIMPEMLGLDGKRREYLVLLQNEMELRATGGFIGSYGILSFQDGRLISFEIKDVYDADGQLQGHVEPPEEIKRYLGEAAWFMRDANWKASFPEAAKDIQWFLEKETNRRVDGVIGVDLAFVKSILNATGEIYVPDFKEKVNKDNLYEQAEFYSESKFFPGSVQKASFLSGVGKQLFMEVEALKTGQRWNLLLGLIDSLESNDLQMVFNEAKTAQVVADLGWDGDLFSGSCGITNCYSDYLYVVESNLGVNKANYFLYRTIEQKVEIKETGVERILRLNYENLAKNSNWPGGDYKNYVRIYLPKDVQVAEVSITTSGIKQNIALNEVKMVNLYNKRELGFLVTVPISKKVNVEVRYGSKIDKMSDKFSYLLYLQRQPGYGDTGMVNLVSIPDGWQPMQVQPAASVVGGKLLFNQKFDGDIKLGVEISK